MVIDKITFSFSSSDELPSTYFQYRRISTRNTYFHSLSFDLWLMINNVVPCFHNQFTRFCVVLVVGFTHPFSCCSWETRILRSYFRPIFTQRFAFLFWQWGGSWAGISGRCGYCLRSRWCSPSAGCRWPFSPWSWSSSRTWSGRRTPCTRRSRSCTWWPCRPRAPTRCCTAGWTPTSGAIYPVSAGRCGTAATGSRHPDASGTRQWPLTSGVRATGGPPARVPKRCRAGGITMTPRPPGCRSSSRATGGSAPVTWPPWPRSRLGRNRAPALAVSNTCKNCPVFTHRLRGGVHCECNVNTPDDVECLFFRNNREICHHRPRTSPENTWGATRLITIIFILITWKNYITVALQKPKITINFYFTRKIHDEILREKTYIGQTLIYVYK